MKKFLFLFLAACSYQIIHAQSDSTGRIFKKFKVDVSLGYAIPQSSNSGYTVNGGVLFAIEPKYAVIDPLSIGLRMEGAVIAHYNSNYSNDIKGQFLGSGIVTADYYFTNSKARPFVGAGVGIYETAVVDSNSTNVNSNNLPTTSQFGFMIRGGVEIGHLRLGIEYNIVGNNSNYLGLKVGACFGGGRLHKKQ